MDHSHQALLQAGLRPGPRAGTFEPLDAVVLPVAPVVANRHRRWWIRPAALFSPQRLQWLGPGSGRHPSNEATEAGPTGEQAKQARTQPICREGNAAVIREDRELLAELARLNSDMAPLALRIMDESASVTEQQHYAQRLIAVGERLQRRVDGMRGPVIDGEVVAGLTALPAHTVELDWKS